MLGSPQLETDDVLILIIVKLLMEICIAQLFISTDLCNSIKISKGIDEITYTKLGIMIVGNVGKVMNM
ncbi:hypothetical protein C2G38_2233840 [Gigaspora rosea]|uniref:Uncharacterized protein n=1 Tax=Gigaspora rosea TaxID=44941 RepID=A0A397TQV2_9GLOM|nr:hypothetical protein C2G38_2233840 [Gigaspora rosea]